MSAVIQKLMLSLYISRALPKELKCVDLVVKAFGCDKDGFMDLVNKMVHSFVPRQCRDQSDNYRWIRKYGLGKSARPEVGKAWLWMLALVHFIFTMNF